MLILSESYTLNRFRMLYVNYSSVKVTIFFFNLTMEISNNETASRPQSTKG